MAVALVPIAGGVAVAAYEGVKFYKWHKASLKESVRSFWSRPHAPAPRQCVGEQFTQEEQVNELQNQSALAQVLSPLDLRGQQIRLLRIEPNDDPTELIQCSFETANLGENPDYVALSYRWGRTNSRFNILVSGELIEVTQNLYEALVKMRKLGIHMVWVDALCIDQRQGLEQHSQFRKLTLIYSRARYVFSWLGCSNDLTRSMEASLNALRQHQASIKMAEPYATERNVLEDLYDLWSRSLTESKHKIQYLRVAESVSRHIAEGIRMVATSTAENETLLQNKHDRFLNALYAVLDNEYWQRAWVLQELTMAGRIEVHYDDHELDWDTFAVVVEALFQLHEDGDFPDLTANHRHVCNIVRLRPQLQRSKLPLITVLRMSYGTKATRECDKVHSLLGLCADDHKFVVTTEQVDLPTLQLRMAQNYISETKNLDMICLRPHREVDGQQENALPSWVPNLVTAEGDRFCHRMLDYLTGHDKHTHLVEGDKYWHATKKDVHLQHRSFGHTRVLCVRARLIGRITDLSGAFDGNNISKPLQAPREWAVSKRSRSELGYFFAENDSILAKRIYEALTVYKSRIAADDNILDFSHLWSTTYLQRIRKRNPRVYQWLVAHENFVIHELTLRDWSPGKRYRLDPRRPIYKAVRTLRHASAAGDEILDGVESLSDLSVIDVVSQRMNAITESVATVLKQGLRLMGGDYDSTISLQNCGDRITGWAHPEARPGDEIYLLQGCSMPVILRSVDDSKFESAYKVVGDAYVAGAMHGELWPCQDLKNINLV